MSRNRSLLGLMALAATACLTGMGHTASAAAILTGSHTGSPSSPVDLTAAGTTDWAIWDYQSGSGTTGAPSNYKAGVTYTNYISNVSALQGTPRAITGSVTGIGFTYSNGTTTASQTNAAIGADTDTSINSAGSGITFTLTGDPGQLETAQIYVAGYNGTGTFTATLNGATTYTDVQGYGGTRAPALYTLNFQPASASDKVTVTFKLSNPLGNANMDVQAVAISVPEPASVGLLGLSAGGLLVRRRRVI